jgi:hypothetical protein
VGAGGWGGGGGGGGRRGAPTAVLRQGGILWGGVAEGHHTQHTHKTTSDRAFAARSLGEWGHWRAHFRPNMPEPGPAELLERACWTRRSPAVPSLLREKHAPQFRLPDPGRRRWPVRSLGRTTSGRSDRTVRIAAGQATVTASWRRSDACRCSDVSGLAKATSSLTNSDRPLFCSTRARHQPRSRTSHQCYDSDTALSMSSALAARTGSRRPCFSAVASTRYLRGALSARVQTREYRCVLRSCSLARDRRRLQRASHEHVAPFFRSTERLSRGSSESEPQRNDNNCPPPLSPEWARVRTPDELLLDPHRAC